MTREQQLPHPNHCRRKQRLNGNLPTSFGKPNYVEIHVALARLV